MISAALSWLRQHQEAVNALNVFPVPDGDTGTNMMLTMTSAWDEIAGIDEPHVGKLMSHVAHGALMGARGNSGVILSQIWRGFAHGLDGQRRRSRRRCIATAMRVAAETAYKGVVKPVEGTILTVARDMSEETSAAVKETDDIIVFFERIVRQRPRVCRADALTTAGAAPGRGRGFRWTGSLCDL